MNDAQTDRWAKLVRAVFGVKGETVLPGVAPEVQPTMPTWPLPAEFRRAAGELECMKPILVTAAVGQISSTGLYNPSDGNMMIVADEVWLATDAANIIWNVRVSSTRLSTVGNPGLRLDLRPYPKVQVPAVNSVGRVDLQIGPAGALPLGQELARVRAVTIETVYLPLRVVLPPGMGVFVSGEATNITIAGAWRWTERPVEPAE